jgi:hypothetical protein
MYPLCVGISSALPGFGPATVVVAAGAGGFPTLVSAYDRYLLSLLSPVPFLRMTQPAVSLHRMRFEKNKGR